MNSLRHDPTTRAVAFALLLNRQGFASRESSAAELGIAPQRVDAALSALEEDRLIDTDRQPINPRLFNALAECWAESDPPVSLMNEPPLQNTRLAESLGFGLEVIERSAGWVLTGKHAQAIWAFRLEM